MLSKLHLYIHTIFLKGSCYIPKHLLGACGEGNDADDIEVNDPMLEDDGENDVGG